MIIMQTATAANADAAISRVSGFVVAIRVFKLLCQKCLVSFYKQARGAVQTLRELGVEDSDSLQQAMPSLRTIIAYRC
jgi:hypothetical protein